MDLTVPDLYDGAIRLRLWRTDDAADIVSIASDPEVPRWTYLPDDIDLEQATEWILRRQADRNDSTGISFAVTDSSNGDVLGAVGLGGIDSPLGAEVFYWLDRSARGRGVATRAVGLLCDWALTTLGLDRLQLFTEPENTRSQRVAERVGFVREGHLRDADVAKDGNGRIDLLLYGLLPRDRGS